MNTKNTQLYWRNTQFYLEGTYQALLGIRGLAFLFKARGKETQEPLGTTQRTGRFSGLSLFHLACVRPGYICVFEEIPYFIYLGEKHALFMSSSCWKRKTQNCVRTCVMTELNVGTIFVYIANLQCFPCRLPKAVTPN